ncbi:MAG: NAD-dependent epimerase/dehydratase [uncultured bacterium]|nr:MAG: NAD-dependent epimerase/dehydratase [uncultured bacterium]
MNNKILVTGATGFVGTRLCEQAVVMGKSVRRVLREVGGVDDVVIGELGPDNDWLTALRGVDAVVHLAARVHVINDMVSDPLGEFRRVNVAGTLNLARQAAASGVRRFVFVSSAKVNGEVTAANQFFTEQDKPAPQDAYAISKWEAEQGLLQLAAETGMEVVIIRPPLVYGPGVKANFLAMMQWLMRGVPFPFASLNNRRSFVALDNLVDFISLCIEHPAAANEVFLVSDGEDLSTPELLQRLGSALGVRAKILPVPLSFLRLGATLIGRSDLFQRLCGSLQVDIAKAHNLLGWSPPVTVAAALLQTAHHFREHQWQ